MKSDIRFGIIGCGRVAHKHADAIQEIEGVTLQAVCDIDPEPAGKFAMKYGATQYADYREILHVRDIDAVIICTPSGLHAQMGIEAARAGKNIIVEKPMSLTVEDADRLIEAVDKGGVKLSVVMQNRYNEAIKDMYEVVSNGRLGRILLGNATVRWYRPQEYYEDDWHGTLAMDGGALMNQSIHHIDALQWLMGGKVESVFAFTGTLAHSIETEDVGVAVFRFQDGTLASVEGSTIAYPKNIEGSVALFGEHGSLKVGGAALNRKVFWKIKGELEHERDILAREAADLPGGNGIGHQLVIEDMVDAMESNRQPATPGAEGRKSVVLVSAMYESAKTGKPVGVKGQLAQ